MCPCLAKRFVLDGKIRIMPLDKRPEPGRVVEVDEMAQLVKQHMANQRLGDEQESEIQADRFPP